MCYSAEVWQDYKQYRKKFGADIDIREFVRLFYRRMGDKFVKIAKAMSASFANPTTPEEVEIAKQISEFDAGEALKYEKELFVQTKRKADAERLLQTKTTKKAQDDLRISTDKISKAKLKLDDLRRSDLKARDSRIFPGWYAPVMVIEGGKRVVKPMRYQCRPEGKPAFYDAKYPGTYNARRDNLEGFWKGLFGYHHGIMVVDAFYENVDRDGKNAVLEFRPSTGQDMLVACLWSRWVGPDGEELLSFAAITDEPPPEVAAAGHDRCIIPIKPENIDAWLSPDPADLPAQYAILDDRERPYYDYRMAA